VSHIRALCRPVYALMMKPSSPATAIILVGPTASGKSAVGVAVCKKVDGEIISCDSMQVYRGMTIGTAKPTHKEQAGVKHHLIDIFSPRTECSVFKHRTLALKAIKDITRRKKIPVLVGGTGLYLKALMDGFERGPGKNQVLRRELNRIANQKGVKALHDRLRRVNPKRARLIHTNDLQRIIRALEVEAITQKDEFNIKKKSGESLQELGYQTFVYGLRWERQELYKRIERRVDQMIHDGWIREAKQLQKKPLSQTARQAIGYHELFRFLRGAMGPIATIEEIKKRTRHLAKKQMTWFRKEKRIVWLEVTNKKQVNQLAEEVVKNMT
jgi:tRNA dimethylallyltransferase